MIKYSKSLSLIGAVLLIASALMINCSGEPEAEPIAEAAIPQDIDTINFTVLRQWRPNDNPAALGLEVLIDEEEATYENIIQMVRELGSDAQIALIRVFQDEAAWRESRTTNHTEIYERGYLAFYIQNRTNSGAYRGLHEIRWFQQEGQLEELEGTTTQFFH
ncbi:MAG: hypothetical protein EA391_04720 [Balneolaceae bacterium]|nr:MAG: hypothetical protein EA391_04720 [Balneolaceae bacterium]